MVRNCKIFCRIARFPHFLASTARSWECLVSQIRPCKSYVFMPNCFTCHMLQIYRGQDSQDLSCFQFWESKKLCQARCLKDHLSDSKQISKVKPTNLASQTDKSGKSNRQIWQVKPTNPPCQTNSQSVREVRAGSKDQNWKCRTFLCVKF